jgi:hypothetical protein
VSDPANRDQVLVLLRVGSYGGRWLVDGIEQCG